MAYQSSSVSPVSVFSMRTATTADEDRNDRGVRLSVEFAALE